MKVLSTSGKLDVCNIVFINRKPIVNLISLRLLSDYQIMAQKQPITLAFEYFHYRLANIVFRGLCKVKTDYCHND
jgi:hypothetical protein